MARHTLHSDLVLPELFMQQKYLFKESTLWNDSVHLERLFCNGALLKRVSTAAFIAFFSIGSIIDLPLISIFTVFFIYGDTSYKL